MSAAVKHMEEDEPDVRYEVAWVDNGSGSLKTAVVENRGAQVEHKVLLEKNMGLAWGLNTLFFDLCTAPFVLILEEDWMYMDAGIAAQTEERRHAVERALAVASSNLNAFDGRGVMGAFLRPETYDSFLKPPHAGQWQVTPSTPNFPQGVEYRVYCGDVSGGSGYLWGSYTNGAGLYNRTTLSEDVGLMFGEPGDGFHDAYVEANYAYRAALTQCHALLRMEEQCPDSAQGCNAAFYHVGGGRGTRPNKKKDVKEPDDSWVFYGTPSYAHVKAQVEQAKQRQQQQQQQRQQEQRQQLGHQRQGEPERRGKSTKKKEKEMRGERDGFTSWEQQQREQEAFQRKVAAKNERVFAAERAKREEMRGQAHVLRTTPGSVLRAQVHGLEGHTDEMIQELAQTLQTKADSPHPLPGFWDGMGHPLGQDDDDDDEDNDGGGGDENEEEEEEENDEEEDDIGDADGGPPAVATVVVDEDEEFFASLSSPPRSLEPSVAAARVGGGAATPAAVQGNAEKGKKKKRGRSSSQKTAAAAPPSPSAASASVSSRTAVRGRSGKRIREEEEDEDEEEEEEEEEEEKSEAFQRRLASKKAALLHQAKLLRQMGAEAARRQVPEFRGKTDQEVLGVADTAERTAANPALLEAVVRAEMAAERSKTKSKAKQTKNKNEKKTARASTATQRATLQQQQQHQHQQQQQQQHRPRDTRAAAAARGGRGGKARIHQGSSGGSDPLGDWVSMGRTLRASQPGWTEREVASAAWGEAAQQHEKQGRRAFTGAGYQEQHAKVQAVLRGWRLAGGEGSEAEEEEEEGFFGRRGTGQGGKESHGSFFEIFSRGRSSAAEEAARETTPRWGLREALVKAIHGPDWKSYV